MFFEFNNEEKVSEKKVVIRPCSTRAYTIVVSFLVACETVIVQTIRRPAMKFRLSPGIYEKIYWNALDFINRNVLEIGGGGKRSILYRGFECNGIVSRGF